MGNKVAFCNSGYLRPYEWVTRVVAELNAAEGLEHPADSVVTDDIEAICGGKGFRQEINTRFGRGRFEALEFEQGMHVHVFSIDVQSPFRVRIVGEEDTLGVGVLAGGPLTIKGEPWGTQCLDDSAAYLLSVPEGKRIEAAYSAGHRYIDVKVRFRPSAFESIFGLPAHYLPLGRGCSAIDGDASVSLPFRYLHRHSDRPVVLAYEMANTAFDGELRYRYLEAKGRELIYELVSTFGTIEEDARQPLRLSRVNVEQIAKARDLLTSTSGERLSNERVASYVGLNVDKLGAGFKQLYGSTLAEFRRERSLFNARRLLLETDLGVADIAGMVGYRHQSTFATAFKQRFGVRPTGYRSAASGNVRLS